ncbi:MAG: S41 family peptidase [Verrucomicrobia bacterium]|nr:S41 family peptidase [Verrucomicrobiota bacterium]
MTNPVSLEIVSYSEPPKAIEQEKLLDEAMRRSLQAAKNDMRFSPLPLKWKERVVSRVVAGVRHLYIDQKLGEKMARVVQEHFVQGKYDLASNPYSFMEGILDDLQSIYPDKHFGVMVHNDPIPDYSPSRSLRTLGNEELTEEQRKYLDSLDMRSDYSKEVDSSIIPDTNIGYLKVNSFDPATLPRTNEILNQAMEKVVGAESLIIDLRANTGGDPETVAYLASHFLEERQLLNQTYDRSKDKTTSFYADPERVEHHFGTEKKIYVLTSPKTLSGAEEFAYDLQATGRAVVVGQPTSGGAHPTRPFAVDDHFELFIPNEKAINPHTRSNWEGTGVEPDILMPADQALDFAIDQLKK